MLPNDIHRWVHDSGARIQWTRKNMAKTSQKSERETRMRDKMKKIEDVHFKQTHDTDFITILYT